MRATQGEGSLSRLRGKRKKKKKIGGRVDRFEFRGSSSRSRFPCFSSMRFESVGGNVLERRRMRRFGWKAEFLNKVACLIFDSMLSLWNF